MKSAAILKEKHMSGYDLTTALIRGELGTLGLNSNAKLVLLYFATCYNSKKGVVFPKMKTIAVAVGISEIGVKRAVAELVGMGYVLKTKKGQNANQYVITNKILKYQDDTTPQVPDDTQKYHDDTSKGITVIPSLHEVKEKELKQTTNKDVADLKKIPDIILKNPEIICKEAYWNKLSDTVKQNYINRQKEIDRHKEQEKQRQEEQRRYFANLREIGKEPPFYTLFDKKEAEKYVISLKKLNTEICNKSSIAQYLIEKFNLENKDSIFA